MSRKGVLTQTESEKEIQLPPFKQNKGFYLSCMAVLCLWLAFCWQGLRTVIEIWYGNEIFNHGFFIVPGAFYLIYLKRHALLAQPIYTAPLAFIVIVPSILLYVVGLAGDIQLFLHAATFTLLPALIWLMIGTKAATTILFPLVFMLFSIPVGEQLIPYLQKIAADGSVALLQLTEVPLFRSGLYIEIPQGRFLVAEACSGVSFFIASFVIGSLYAYLNLESAKRRATFVAISLIFPILANIVRVYGIILIAYWTDMEHAAGADHLIYGWFFFAFVILCLLGIGELMRESVQSKKQSIKPSVSAYSKTQLSVVTVILVCGVIWNALISQSQNSNIQPELPTLKHLRDNSCGAFYWQPLMQKPNSETQFGLINTDCSVSIYSAWFSEVDNELVSSLNRLFDPEKWSAESYDSLRVSSRQVSIISLTTPNAAKVELAYWYVVNSKVFTSATKVKLYQTWLRMVGRPSAGSIWVVASTQPLTEQTVSRALSKI